MNPNPKSTECEELERAAIAAYKQEEQETAERMRRNRVKEEKEAFAQLKKTFPLLERGQNGRFILCGKEWAYRCTGTNWADMSAHYCLESPGRYGDWVYDMASLGRWFEREKERKVQQKPRSFWDRFFGT